jgi:hypothetical protein
MWIIFYTFSPVAGISSIQVLIVLASIYNLFIHHLDVKTVFLNCDPKEDIYMLQHKCYIVPDQ